MVGDLNLLLGHSADAVAASNSVLQAMACMPQLLQSEQMVMHQADKAWGTACMPVAFERAASKHILESLHAVTAEAEVLCGDLSLKGHSMHASSC